MSLKDENFQLDQEQMDDLWKSLRLAPEQVDRLREQIEPFKRQMEEMMAMRSGICV